jgi:hypothetical protein
VISDSALVAQYDRAVKEWPWLHYVERIRGLPRFLLFAVASRETNMRNILGDGGHGVGIFQRDDRAWRNMPTPAGPLSSDAGKAWYLAHPRQQAEDAADLLLANRRTLRNWNAAFAAYNAGVGAVNRAVSNGRRPDSVTTGGDYGADVQARLNTLRRLRG